MADIREQGPQPKGWSWRDRAQGSIPVGATLNPLEEPIEGLEVFPTAYVPDRLLVTMMLGSDGGPYSELRAAAAAFGWGLVPQRLDGDGLPTESPFPEPRFPGAPVTIRVRLTPSDEQGRQSPASPDAWKVLQRARRDHYLSRVREQGVDPSNAPARLEREDLLPGVGLEHIVSIDPVGLNPFTQTNPYTKTNPYTQTNPYTRTNPYTKTNPCDEYATAGSGGRQPVAWLGPAPARRPDSEIAGRRPVVAILDTGAGPHDWLPESIVDRHVTLDGVPIGLTDDANPELYPDLYGPMDGAIDIVSGHGTFIAGLIRQAAPDADLLAIRAADAMGVVEESALLDLIEEVGVLLARHCAGEPGGRPVDVLNLSLGYYHETPQDGAYSLALYYLLAAVRALGCTVVCSAGNDCTDRPTFPASLWPWPGSDNGLQPDDYAEHISVGSLNASAHTTALFSNIGPWVKTWAVGASVVSTVPGFRGGFQATSRDDAYGRDRETQDPDDYRGGFAIWSGTSFAAPVVAGRVAHELTPMLAEDGARPAAPPHAVKRARQAAATVLRQGAGTPRS